MYQYTANLHDKTQDMITPRCCPGCVWNDIQPHPPPNIMEVYWTFIENPCTSLSQNKYQQHKPNTKLEQQQTMNKQ